MTISPQETVALHWHLAFNHYPPHPTVMVPLAARALAKARRGEFDAKCLCPPGVRWKGQRYVRVGDLVESFHLDDFLTDAEEA